MTSDDDDGARSAPDQAFPFRLRTARELRGLSAVELGRRCDIPATSLSHFESGSRKPSFGNLAKLAAELRVSTDYLLGRADQPSLPMEADVLFRQVQELSDDDLALTKDFIDMLAGRGRTRGKAGEAPAAVVEYRGARRRRPPGREG